MTLLLIVLIVLLLAIFWGSRYSPEGGSWSWSPFGVVVFILLVLLILHLLGVLNIA